MSSFFFSLTGEDTPLYEIPKSFIGWMVWLGMGAVLLFMVWRYWRFHPAWNGRKTGLFILLLILTPILSVNFGIRLPAGNALPPPGIPLTPIGPVLMIFASLTWIFAAGVLGPAPAGILAGISGATIALYDGHNFYMPLLYALFGVYLSSLFRQPYRTPFFQLVRQPLVSASLFSFVLYPILYLGTTGFLVNDTFPVQLDFAISRVGWATVAFVGQASIASIFAQVMSVGWPAGWRGEKTDQPSPAERSLESRLLNVMAPAVVFLMLVVMAGTWVVAGNAAQKMLEERMSSTSYTAATSIPFALETGQNLIVQLVEDDRLYQITSQAELVELLLEDLRTVPYFHFLAFIDPSGVPLAGYPEVDYQNMLFSPDEQLGIALANQGVPFQSYSLPAREGDTAGQLSFMANITDETGALQGILLGRTRLSTNPFIQPALETMATLKEIGGEAMLLDEQGILLYHTIPELVGTQYLGSTSIEAAFLDDPAPDGTRQIVHYQPLLTRSWAIVTTVPARITQEIAMQIAIPLVGLLSVVAVILYVALWAGIRVVTRSLRQLIDGAGRIAEGDLDHALDLGSADEVGQLGESFERMRVGLKSRMNEVHQLLFVTQGVASAMELESAVKPILEGALTTGASSARLVMTPAALPEFEHDTPPRFGLGESSERYAGLDGQVLGLTEMQDEVMLSNPSRAGLKLEGGIEMPSALMAVALRHEGIQYGALWVAYDGYHKFEKGESQFLATVAGQAALAASNARLYLTAQVGRQRLEAILAATPDPVLVTDHRGHLLLSNPAANALFQNGVKPASGVPIDRLVDQPELLELLRSEEEDSKSVEVEFSDSMIYFATASPVFADGKLMGRVCVLNDITYYKELDTLKSEFVSTVSHDLRSPLTLIRGYATMLQMVGELNEQQEGYIKKIVNGVESMSGLVSNLLDLGRIEAGVGLQLELVPFLDVIKHVIETLQSQADQKQIKLNVNLPQATMPLVEADQALLQQAIYNLVENSIKYTNPDGVVDITLQEAPDEFKLTVKDNGIGISPVDVPKLFDRFFRAVGREARKQRGSGLGLAIVKSITERHGGKVWVESQLGKGSTFYMNIPLRQENK